jgi:hypothetical protein
MRRHDSAERLAADNAGETSVNKRQFLVGLRFRHHGWGSLDVVSHVVDQACAGCEQGRAKAGQRSTHTRFSLSLCR